MARSLQIVAAICSVAAAALWWMASGQLPDPPSGAFAEAVEPQKPIYRAAALVDPIFAAVEERIEELENLNVAGLDARRRDQMAADIDACKSLLRKLQAKGDTMGRPDY